MIQKSYIFLPKVRHLKENSIWEQGIGDWDSFISRKKIKGISPRIKKEYDSILSEAKQALHDSDSGFFCKKLPSVETWRLYKYFMDEAVFLDVEASAAGKENSYLTVIGLFDGIATKTMIRDINLDIRELRKELSRYKILVTFNGSSFDIPFLNKRYPGLIPEIPHIDVRHLCSRIGLDGGLKEIERKLNIQRTNQIVEQMYGGDPYRLWRMFRASGDDYYLRLLVEYNEEDVINLKRITEYSINELEKRYPI